MSRHRMVLLGMLSLVIAVIGFGAQAQAYSEDFYPADPPYTRWVTDGTLLDMLVKPQPGRTIDFWVGGIQDDIDLALTARDWGPPSWAGETGITWRESANMFTSQVKYWDGSIDLSVVGLAQPTLTAGDTVVDHVDITFNTNYTQPGGCCGWWGVAADFSGRAPYRRELVCHETGHAVGMGHDRVDGASCMQNHVSNLGKPGLLAKPRERQLVAGRYAVNGY
jgi:hypothetical protein